MHDVEFIEHNGITIKFTPDDTVDKGQFFVGQYADQLGKRFLYYEVRHYSQISTPERLIMIRKVKDMVC